MKLDDHTIAALNKVPSALADNVGRLSATEKARQEQRLAPFMHRSPAQVHAEAVAQRRQQRRENAEREAAR